MRDTQPQEAIETGQHTVQSPDSIYPGIVSIEVPIDTSLETQPNWDKSKQAVPEQYVTSLKVTDAEVRDRYLTSMGSVVQIEVDTVTKHDNAQSVINRYSEVVTRSAAEQREKAVSRRDRLIQRIEQDFEDVMFAIDDYETSNTHEVCIAQKFIDDSTAESQKIFGALKQHINTVLTRHEAQIRRRDDNIKSVDKAHQEYGQRADEIVNNIKELHKLNKTIESFEYEKDSISTRITELQGEIRAEQLKIAQPRVKQKWTENPQMSDDQVRTKLIEYSDAATSDEIISMLVYLEALREEKRSIERRLTQMIAVRDEAIRRNDSLERRRDELVRRRHEDAGRLETELKHGRHIKVDSESIYSAVTALEQLQSGRMNINSAPKSLQALYFANSELRTQMQKMGGLSNLEKVPVPKFFEDTALPALLENTDMATVAAEVETADDLRSNAVELSERFDKGKKGLIPFEDLVSKNTGPSERVIKTKRRLGRAGTSWTFGKN